VGRWTGWWKHLANETAGSISVADIHETGIYRAMAGRRWYASLGSSAITLELPGLEHHSRPNGRGQSAPVSRVEEMDFPAAQPSAPCQELPLPLDEEGRITKTVVLEDRGSDLPPELVAEEDSPFHKTSTFLYRPSEGLWNMMNMSWPFESPAPLTEGDEGLRPPMILKSDFKTAWHAGKERRNPLGPGRRHSGPRRVRREAYQVLEQVWIQKWDTTVARGTIQFFVR